MKFLIIFLVLAQAVASFATTRYVAKDGSAPYTEVQNAINASAAGDTILVAPSATTYNGFNVDRRLVLFGASYDQTAGKATKIAGIVEIFNAGDSTELISFWLRFSAGSTYQDSVGAIMRLRSGATGVRVSRCLIENTNGSSSQWKYAIHLNIGATAIIDACVIWDSHSNGGNEGIYFVAGSPAASATITNCLFSHWTSYAIEVRNSNTVCHVRHCVFDCSNGVSSSSTFLTAQNCVLASTGTFLYGSGLVTYCATGGTAPAGEGNFTWTGTPFVNRVANAPLSSDYHLSSGSMLRDVGNPISPPDLDGSRADIGIYGGQTPFIAWGIPPIPFVLELEVPVTVPQNGVLHIGARGRIGPGN